MRVKSTWIKFKIAPTPSLQEVSGLIELLKVNKAPYVDCVLPEIIKKNPS